MLHNTLHGMKEPLETVEPGTVKMYSCGPTVYDYFHIGNSRAFVVPDVLKRYLRYRGYRVVHVQNITDIEDKIIARAAEMGVSFREVVERFTEAFFEDARLLGCDRADVHPKATDHIPEIVKLIERLIDRGLAYAVDGDVYYDVSRFPDYGVLSKQSLDELEAGARVEVGERKADPLDFALWKAAKSGEPSWESPWGAGRPGWHIECSAMSMKYLGEQFDIHTGGADLVFPHHENEIAQSVGATGAPFARYWLHNGYINIDGAKMSKSKGNFFTFRELAGRYDAEVLRLFLLSKHYRSPIDFTQEAVESIARGLSRLHAARDAVRGALAGVSGAADSERGGEEGASAHPLGRAAAEARRKFEAGMDDDLNTSKALAALFDLARESNRYVKGATGRAAGEADAEFRTVLREVDGAFRDLGAVLGILQRPAPPALAAGGATAAWGEEREGDREAARGAAGEETAGLVERLVELLIDVRAEARARRDFATADEIRDRLRALHVQLEDGPDGTTWRMRREGSGT